MNTTIKPLKMVVQVIWAVLSAIAILTIYPERERQRQIQQAKRNIAERSSQIEARKAVIEVELKALKAELKATAAQSAGESLRENLTHAYARVTSNKSSID